MVSSKLGLPNYELLLYGLIWTLSILYASYHVYIAGKLFDDAAIGDDFERGWFNLKKDVADYEWATWAPFIWFKLPYWIVAHTVLTEITRWLLPQAIPVVNCVITSSFLIKSFGPIVFIFVMLKVVIFYALLRYKSVTIIWLFGLPLLLLSCFALDKIWEVTDSKENMYHFVIISTTWLYLRCTSFCIDAITSRDVNTFGKFFFYDLLGYSFYFPTYFLGPFILYADFGPYMYQPLLKWSKKRICSLLFNILRYLFWAMVAECSLYFLFVHALQYQMLHVVQMGEWTLYGLGFLIGQFFYLKYIVVYGLASTIAKFDGYHAPPPPKCTARIHLYTDMWRVFDVGFYQFIHKYIYAPLCKGQRKLTHRLMASAVCFSFVFLWHGPYLSVFIWSVLNFLGVSLVSFGSSISKSTMYKNWEKRTLSEANSRRLTALVSAPMFIMGPVSSFYFFCGTTVGNTYIDQIFCNGTWTGLVSLIFVSYCMCQVSIELKNWEQARDRKLKSI